MARRTPKWSGFRIGEIHRLLDSIFGEDLHAKRVYSLANATLGVIASASLAVHLIGQGLAQARGLVRKQAIKQVDRLLSNRGLEVWSLFAHRVAYVVGASKAIVVALDWREFEHDGHSTRMLSLVTRHGRATPLVWKTVEKATLAGRRNSYEDEVLARLAEVLPKEVAVTVLADRGFGDVALYHLLEHGIGFDYVIRFRGNLLVSDAQGNCRSAAQWLGPSGQARTHRLRRGNRPGLSGSNGGVRAGPGHGRTLVPGGERPAGSGTPAHRALCQALEHRARLARHQRPALRDGNEPRATQQPTAPRPAVADQCPGRGVADLARRRWRKPGLRPSSEGQYGEAANPFALYPRLPALRPTTEYAG